MNLGRVLVIGGGGFLGQNVIAALLQSGFTVSALDLFMPPGFDSVDWSVGSAGDESLVAAAVGGCSTVIYLAASSLPGSSNVDIAAEVEAHVKLAVKSAELCCTQGVKTFVFSSSGGTVYGQSAGSTCSETDPTHPLSAYGVSKLAIEKYLGVLSRLRGMRCISLRVANPFGPGQRAVRNQGFIGAAMGAAVKGEALLCWGDGSVVRDFIYVADVAAAFVRCCTYEGPSTVINIGSGQGHTLMDVIKNVEEVSQQRIDVRFLRDRAFDVSSNVLSTAWAKKALGWEPQTSFVEGLEVTWHWWRKNTPACRRNAAL